MGGVAFIQSEAPPSSSRWKRACALQIGWHWRKLWAARSLPIHRTLATTASTSTRPRVSVCAPQMHVRASSRSHNAHQNPQTSHLLTSSRTDAVDFFGSPSAPLALLSPRRSCGTTGRATLLRSRHVVDGAATANAARQLDPQPLAVQSVGVLIGSPLFIPGKLPLSFGRSCGPTGQRFIQPSPFGLGHRYPMMVGEAQRAGHSSWSRNDSIIGSCVAARGLQYEGPPSLPAARRTSRRDVLHAWISRQRDRLPCVASRCVDRPCPCRLRALADCHDCGAR